MDWTSESIIIHNWPKLKQRSDGKWQRIWEIVLEEESLNDISISNLEKDLSTDENQVFIHFKNSRELVMEVVTERWGWEDDLYFYSYQILKGVNDNLGKISTIQGQERDLWNPWLAERKRT